MLTILNSLNAHNFPIFEPILMILVSKFKVHGVLSEQTYLPLGLLSPLNVSFIYSMILDCLPAFQVIEAKETLIINKLFCFKTNMS